MSLRVTDEGPGIPAEIRDRMFDPFFTTKTGGSGLGLAVVHRAIEAHRGLVFVDSEAARHALHRHAARANGSQARLRTGARNATQHGAS